MSNPKLVKQASQASMTGGSGRVNKLKRLRTSSIGNTVMAFNAKDRLAYEALVNGGDVANEAVEDSAEIRRLAIKKFMTQSKFGKFYFNLLLGLSIFSAFEFIYQSYLHPSIEEDRKLLNRLNDLELAFAFLFGFDWGLSFYLADHKLIFCRSFFSMVDVATIIPIFVTYGHKLPDVNEINTFTDAAMYTMFAFSTTRILRGLRVRRVIMQIEDPVDRFMGDMCVKIVIMIMFFTSAIQFIEEEFQNHDYHTWTYYVWVTITTVGYGDISPISTQGRMAAMCFIGIAIITVPQMTNELIEKMALQSVYARNSYHPKSSNSQHILICGDVSSISIDEFFGELFHEDHDNAGLQAVMLLPSAPTTEILLMMENSSYFTNMTYLEGSALNDKDLKRAKAESALAVFIMTNKFSPKPNEEDAKSILLKLSIKRYVSSYEDALPQLFCLQLIRPQNRKHLGHEDYTDGTDLTDLVVCLNEIKMGVLAKGVMYPGANTLLMNLISSFSQDQIPPEADGEESFSGLFTTSSGRVAPKTWISEYTSGVGWEIYTSGLSPKFEGCKFADLAYVMYKKIGVVLFALQITDVENPDRTRLLLNPANYCIPNADHFSVIAFVIAENASTADLTFSNDTVHDNDVSLLRKFASHPERMSVSLSTTSSSKALEVDSPMNPTKKMANAISSIHRSLSLSTNLMGNHAYGAGNEDDALDDDGNFISADDDVDGEGGFGEDDDGEEEGIDRSSSKVMFSYQEKVMRLKESHFRKSYYLRKFPATLGEVSVAGRVAEKVPELNDHIIIVGSGFTNLFDLIRPLRARYLGALRHIVIVSSDPIPADVWSRISAFDAVHFVLGSPLEERNLRRAGIFHAERVIILADGGANSAMGKLQSTAGTAAGGTASGGIGIGVGMDALVDSDAIFAYQRIRVMHPEAQVVAEIVNTSNISYMHSKNLHGNPKMTGHYKFSTHFAAGELFTTSLLDSIVCQGYYNPHIINVLNKLISGVDTMEKQEHMARVNEKALMANKRQRRKSMVLAPACPPHDLLQAVAEGEEEGEAEEGEAEGEGAVDPADEDSSSCGPGKGDTVRSIQPGDCIQEESAAATSPVKMKSAVSKGSSNTSTSTHMVDLSDIKGSCLCQIKLPEEYRDSSYGILFKGLSRGGVIPLGLMRGTGGSVKRGGNSMPYVFTNPPYDTDLRADDKVFILSMDPPCEFEEPGTPHVPLQDTTDKVLFQPRAAPARSAPISQQDGKESVENVDEDGDDKNVSYTTAIGNSREMRRDIRALEESNQKLQKDFQSFARESNRKFDEIMRLLTSMKTNADDWDIGVRTSAGSSSSSSSSSTGAVGAADLSSEAMEYKYDAVSTGAGIYTGSHNSTCSVPVGGGNNNTKLFSSHHTSRKVGIDSTPDAAATNSASAAAAETNSALTSATTSAAGADYFNSSLSPDGSYRIKPA